VNPEVPTGSTSQMVRQYYDYLYSHYLSQITQNYYIHWDILGWVILWIVVLAGAFFAYTRWQRYTSNPDEPYPLESYNGYIQESNGPIGTFLTIFFIVMFLWLLSRTIFDLIFGQIY
jgi:hypothetical protein